MSKFQVVCPKCNELIWVADNQVGHQMNCTRCDHVLTVLDNSTSALDKLQLVSDPAVAKNTTTSYATLASHGITPASTMADVQDIFPESEEEEVACDELGTITSRLQADFLLYPDWESE